VSRDRKHADTVSGDSQTAVNAHNKDGSTLVTDKNVEVPMSEQLAVTQTQTDTAAVTFHGPVAVIAFNWAESDHKRDMLLASSRDVKQATSKKAKRGVSKLASLRNLTLLSEAGLAHLHTHGAGFLYGGRVSGIDLDSLVVTSKVSADELNARLDGMTVDDITRRVIEVDGSSHGVWRLDQGDADGPMNVPVEFKVSNRFVDIDAAQAMLEQRDDVHAVTRRDGRPGSYDHVPASLDVTVTFDDATWEKLCAYALERYGTYRRAGNRPPAPSSALVSEAVTWPLHSGGGPVGDVLGLAGFARDHYDEPDDDRW
jgi:hypothetical protein